MYRKRRNHTTNKEKNAEEEEAMDALVAYNRYRNSENIVLIAFLSRVMFIALMFICDAFVSDYDTSSSPSSNKKSGSTLTRDGFCSHMESIAVWDGVHVLRIAEVGGYEYEHSHAFYPALPFLLRFIIRDSEMTTCVLARTALVLNAMVSIATVVIMEKLAFILLANPQKGKTLDVPFAGKCASFSRSAALLYCFTPAFIFHLAPGYTEAIFTFCATYGALLFARGSMYEFDGARATTDWRFVLNKVTSYVFFALAASFRSNGILLGIYPACEIISSLLAVKRERKYWFKRLVSLPIHVIGGLCIALPTVLVQYNAYLSFCGIDSGYEIGGGGSAVEAAKSRPWCSKFPPNVYAFIQSEYWDVGFLQSWRVSQMGNILIASPALLASMYCLKMYSFIRRDRVLVSPVGALAGDILWLISCVLCATVTHIQIAMRFMSVLAAPYVAIARFGGEESERGKYLLASFVAGYALVGMVLFSNFYPWT